MVKKTKIQKDLEKKQKRRWNELLELNNYTLYQAAPVPPKKPIEFAFDKDDVQSFEYPVALGNFLVEKKSDGKCVLATVDHSRHEPVKIYSSQMNEWNPKCFPEVVADLLKQPSGYYHGELLGANALTSIDEFKAVTNRPKDNAANLTPEKLRKYPLKLDIFDLLMMDGESFLAKPLIERRSNLEHHIQRTGHVDLIPQWIAEDKESMQSRYIWALENGYEGLIAKDPWSFYVPGKRNNDWIKLKEFITLDLAILGFYETPESQAAGKPFSAVLVGSYNPKSEKFETMAKVRIGAKKDQEEIYSQISRVIYTGNDYQTTLDASPHIEFNPAMQKQKRKIPHRIIPYDENRDILVAEFQMQDITYSKNWHTCGLGYDGKRAHSLRIPTFKYLRDDKSRVEDITTTQQIHELYAG